MRDRLLETTSTGEPEDFDRAIDIRILRLRRKIEDDPARPMSLRTVCGAGYMVRSRYTRNKIAPAAKPA